MAKKRIQVMIPDDVYSIVEEISKLGGVSMGSLLGELVSESKSALTIIRDALIASKSTDQISVINRMQALLTDTQQKGLDAQKEMNELREKHQK